RKSVAARATFVRALQSRDAETRIFGAQGLAAIAPDEASSHALAAALADDDARVVCEVVRALGAHPDDGTRGLLEKAIQHRSPHVQRLAYEAWGALGERGRDERSLSSRAMTSDSLGVRNAAFIADARLQGAGAKAAVELRLDDRQPLARTAAAEAA